MIRLIQLPRPDSSIHRDLTRDLVGLGSNPSLVPNFFSHPFTLYILCKKLSRQTKGIFV